jgi:hypothetical protein
MSLVKFNARSVATCPVNNVTTFPDRSPGRSAPTFPVNNARTCPDNSARPSMRNNARTCPVNNAKTFPVNSARMCPDNNARTYPDSNVNPFPGKSAKPLRLPMAVNKPPPSILQQSTKGIIISDSLEKMNSRRKVFINIPSNETFYQIIRTILIIITTSHSTSIMFFNDMKMV